MYEVPESDGAFNVSDLPGENYYLVLKRMHETLKPRAYFEIGVLLGETLINSTCPTIAVDPNVQIKNFDMFSHSEIHFYQMGNDEFFSKHSPKTILGRPIDYALLDGMHLCEFLLRIFSIPNRIATRTRS